MTPYPQSSDTDHWTLRVFFLLILLMVGCHHGPDLPPSTEARSSSNRSAEALGTEGQAELRTIVEAGTLADLRWADFSDYQDDVAKFYETYDRALPWVRDMQPTPQARATIALLQNADEKGLVAEDYDGSRWSERLRHLKPTARSPKPSDLVHFDVALTVSAMRYISDLHIGRVNPRHLNFAVDTAARRYNLPEFLREDVVDASNVPDILRQVEPPYPGYQRTIRALSRYREIAREDNDGDLSAIKSPTKLGDLYPDVQRLSRLLVLLGDLQQSDVRPDETAYRGPLVDAVKNFQKRHGLTADGQIDSHTLMELNVPVPSRIRQMELTLERWRWLPDDYQHSSIVVNIPEFRLRAYDDQFRIAVTMNVVVGKAYGHSTPVFMNKMQYVTFRPYWNVPPSIARAEIIPSLERNSAYLTQENMDVVDAHENVVASGEITDDMLQDVRRGKLSFRQRPGPTNSLGLIKFMFPNEYDIYMHDTPATELFSKSRRDFSHGCIRLEKPVDLAVWVLRDNPGWTNDRIRAAMNGTQTEDVHLTHPISVLIVYGTVIVSEDGVVHFYDDIYQHDAALEQALGQGYPYPR
jgi:murein L,D-transpeptidase YcbB/YkuD